MKHLRQHIFELNTCLAFLEESVEKSFEEACKLLAQCVLADGKVLIFGNGGSAADAQHFASELVASLHGAPFPKPIAAIALTTNSSVITAISNDEDFRNIFSRQIEALTRPNDLVIGLSTSGRSENVLRGLEAALNKGANSFTIVGELGLARPSASCEIRIPSNSTQVIQVVTTVLLHQLCESLEELRRLD